MTADHPEAMLAVEVAVALPERQHVVELAVPANTTVQQAIELSALRNEFPEIDFATAPTGVWGRQVERQENLKEGDRVEIYRPLTMDPREARRQLAAQGKVMGKAGLAGNRD